METKEARTRAVGQTRVATLVAADGNTNLLLIDTPALEDTGAAEKWIKSAPPGDYAVLRLVKAVRVEHVQRVETTVAELPFGGAK